MIDLGMSLEDVLAAEPTAEFDERFGDPAAGSSTGPITALSR